MEFGMKQVENLYCPKCGGVLSEDKQYGIGLCLNCESAFLLTEEEMAILKKQDVKSTVLKGDPAMIVSRLCAENKSWGFASDYMYVSGSMKKSIMHKAKMKKAQKNWRIPEEEEVFLIADSGTIPYAEGFALASGGLYFVENSCKIRGHLTWREFKNAKITAAGNNLLLINDLHFDIYFSSKDVARVLKTIQMSI